MKESSENKSDEEIRKMLIGSWGHQDDDAVYYYTLNPDGSFIANQNWKRGLKKAFSDDVKSSGTWKLEEGILIMKVTSSNDSKRRWQLHSVRVTRISPESMSFVDSEGRSRREWRVR